MNRLFPATLTPAELRERFGPLPPGRVVADPAPGTATVDDWRRLHRGGDFDLIDGVLLRRAADEFADWLGGELLAAVGAAAETGRSGHAFNGRRPVAAGRNRCQPACSFVRFADLPGGLRADGYSDVPPALVAETLSPGNTAREIERKRAVSFAAGVELVWEADPLGRTVVIWTGPDASVALTAEAGDTLTGGSVLPGFSVDLAELFAPPAPAG